MTAFTATLLLALATAQAPSPGNVPIPPKLPPPPGEAIVPSVTIRALDNGDRVEEYREGGKIYMVRVTPKHGKPYYLYDDDRNGRLDRSDAARADVSPVYWKIYEWD